MAKQIIVLEEAWADIDDAGNYYQNISARVRKRFEEQFVSYLEKLETGVVSFKLYKQKYRCVSMASFPFKIYYKETPDTIVVAAIIHSARGTHFLKRKLP